jgi:hypothetical protein
LFRVGAQLSGDLGQPNDDDAGVEPNQKNADGCNSDGYPFVVQKYHLKKLA